MTEPRQWYNVGAIKLPRKERNLSAAVFDEHPERFYDIIGANTTDNDENHPIGSHTTYSAFLTEREAEAFDAAGNSRYVEVNEVTPNVKHDLGTYLPRPLAQRYMQAEVDAYPSLTGQNVRIAVLDEGTTAAVRAAKNVTLISRATFLPSGEPSGEIWPGLNHGCLCMSDAVPYGGQVIDGFVIQSNGSADAASFANAVNWSVSTNAAKIVSVSLGFAASNAITDAFAAAGAFDVSFCISSGNSNLNSLAYPSSLCTSFNYIHSVGSVDMIRSRRSSFSNYSVDMTGLAPGEQVYGMIEDATIFEWIGTSAAAPFLAQMIARIMSTGVSSRQAAAALKATTRDFGLGAEQGGGVYSMQAALRWLNKEPPIVITPGAVKPPAKGGALPLW